MNLLKKTLRTTSFVMVCGWAMPLLAEPGGAHAQTCGDPSHLHCSATRGDPSQLFKPELSVTADTKLDISDQNDKEDEEKLRIDHLELQVSGYLAPNIHGTAMAALEQEYVDGESETETELEEAFIRIFDLPAGLEFRAGRTLVPFGVLNQSHSHEWMFADTPAAFEEVFGDHSWFDDGIQLRWSNRAEESELLVGLILSIFNGRTPAHVHEEDEHEDEDHDEQEESVEWEGKVWLARAYSSLPVSEDARLVFGGSAAGDERSDTLIAAGDLTLIAYLPDSAKRLLWQTEVFHTDQEERDASPMGMFSVLSLDLDHRWQVGGRYDWSEQLLDDSETIQGGAAFLTYRFAPHAFVRGQFRQIDDDLEGAENIGTLQLVWGLGKHGH